MAVVDGLPSSMSQTAFADLAGVSKGTVTKWKKKGFVVLDDTRAVDVARSVALLIDKGYGNFGAVTQPAPQVTPAPLAQPIGDDGCQPTPDQLAVAMIASGDFELRSVAEANRVQENYLALKNRLSFELEAGRLVDKAKVEVKIAERWLVERTAWENRPSAVSASMGAEHGIDAIKMRVILEQFVEEHLKERVAKAEKPDG